MTYRSELEMREPLRSGVRWLVLFHEGASTGVACLDDYDPTTGEIRSSSTDDIAC